MEHEEIFFFMCGIVGYIGSRDAVEIVLSGLRRLEYRGYDSAGVSVVRDGSLSTVKCEGKLARLDKALAQTPLTGSLAIGHTRWATHGPPTETNAHPHTDEPNEIAIVHNGIIENYQQIREDLSAQGVAFRTETDSETIAHLVRSYYEGDLFDAVRQAVRRFEGGYAIGVIAQDNPDVLVAARSGSPLIVGMGDGEAYIASDVPSIMKHTRRVFYLDSGHVCEVRRDGLRVESIDGEEQEFNIETVEWDDAAAEKDGYPHFMLKEIHQQPDVLRNTLQGRVSTASGNVELDGLSMDEDLRACAKFFVVACGTAWHASLVGKRLIESFAGLPVEVDTASEFRYRDPIVPEGSIVIPVSQSGETADTLEAIRIARAKGAKVLSIVNAVGSSITRESDGVLHTQAGPEIGVASTKAYTSQLAAFALLAIYLGRLRGVMTESRASELIEELQGIPAKLQWCLDHQQDLIRCAQDPRYRDPQSAFFMGRGYNLPSALEGALKLKEISYIHAEGYGAGEMKHGPIALITDRVPMICIATQSAVYEKVLSNIQEIRARGGIMLAIATLGDEKIAIHCDDVIYVPECGEALSPIVVAAPLQLFAYHVALGRGCDVDQPRNLAKSVTVE
jgi:glucosamine--fructose-6-phosphate aminotransferase (isomerizing)